MKKYRKSNFVNKAMKVFGAILGILAIFTSYFYFQYGVSPLTYYTVIKPTVNCVGDCWELEDEVSDVKIIDKNTGKELKNSDYQAELRAGRKPSVTYTWQETSRTNPEIKTQVTETDKNNVTKERDNLDGTKTTTVISVAGNKTGQGQSGTRTTYEVTKDANDNVVNEYRAVAEVETGKVNNKTGEAYKPSEVTTPSTPTTSASGSCPGANSGIGGQQWAQTGGGVEGTDIRYCVQCGGSRKDGKQGPGVWGDEIVECGKGPATHYVTRPDQVVEGKGMNNCWANGSWYADSTVQGGSSFCNDGKWQSKDEFIASKTEKCGPNSVFDLTSLSCQAKPVAVITPVQDGPNAVGTKPNLTAKKGKDCTKEACTKSECIVASTNSPLNDTCTPIQGTDKYGLVDKDFLAVGGAINTTGGKPGIGGRYMYDFTLGGRTETVAADSSIKTGVEISNNGFNIQLGKYGIGLDSGKAGVGGYLSTNGVLIAGGTLAGAGIGVATGTLGCASTLVLIPIAPVCGLVGGLAGGLSGLVMTNKYSKDNPTGSSGLNTGATISNQGFDVKVGGVGVGVDMGKVGVGFYSNDKPTEVGIVNTPDAPGLVGYDTAGALAGAGLAWTASIIPCAVPLVVPLAGVPLHIACRGAATIAGALAGNKTGDYIYKWTH